MQLLKIGYFSRLSHVPVRTLHYYDQIGLFKPACVDPDTGYRYYALEQLAEINRILALKDLGLSLEQITRMLEGDLSRTELRGMLRLRESELRAQQTALEAEMARVLAWLRQLEMEDKMPDYDVVLKTVEPMLVAAKRITIPTNDQVPTFLNGAFEEVQQHLEAQGVKIAGPALARWHTSPDVYADEVVEAIYHIDRPILEADGIRMYELPAERVAAVVHQGDFEQFTNGHKALLGWAEASGYRLNGAYREIYHACENPKHSTTEIQFPVEKV